MSDDKWWERFFDEDFSSVLLDRENDPSLDLTADFLIAVLGLQPGEAVFDQCCGTGSVSLALAKKGMFALGIDQAAHYVERAKHRAAADGLGKTFFEAADAFEYLPPWPCHAAINWYSSFGYTPDDRQNVEMLHRIRESLLPGGRFALDYMNVPNLLANFQPVFTREKEIDGQTIIFEKHTHIDSARGMVGSRWVYKFPDGTEKEASGESRLYMPGDIIRLLRDEAGFTDFDLYGGINGEPCNEEAERCIVVARAPG